MISDYIFNQEVFENLADDSQQKVEIIYKIAVLLVDHAPGTVIDPGDFDMLYDQDLGQLQTYYRDAYTKLTGSIEYR